MSERKSRRGFLGALGKMMAAAPLVGVPIDTKLETAFKFQCDCGSDILAAVPKEKGMIAVQCGTCKVQHILDWRGTHFKFKGTSKLAP